MYGGLEKVQAEVFAGGKMFAGHDRRHDQHRRRGDTAIRVRQLFRGALEDLEEERGGGRRIVSVWQLRVRGDFEEPRGKAEIRDQHHVIILLPQHHGHDLMQLPEDAVNLHR